MEKIIVALDSQHMDPHTVIFACELARLTRSGLTGIFLEKYELEEEIIYRQTAGQTYIESIGIREAAPDENAISSRFENMNLFRELARAANINPVIHLDKGVPINEILEESRFSDVLIMDAAISFSGIEENPPTEFVKSILHDAGCPIIISPAVFEGIDNIIFCYDGSKSSFFAMKQFTYLFPEMRSKRVKIIYLNDGEELAEEEERRVREWVRFHYDNDVEWVIPYNESRSALFEYLVHKKTDFVVMGAYGKGLLTSFFQENQDENGIRTSVLPIFVSHF